NDRVGAACDCEPEETETNCSQSGALQISHLAPFASAQRPPQIRRSSASEDVVGKIRARRCSEMHPTGGTIYTATWPNRQGQGVVRFVAGSTIPENSARYHISRSSIGPGAAEEEVPAVRREGEAGDPVVQT